MYEYKYSTVKNTMITTSVNGFYTNQGQLDFLTCVESYKKKKKIWIM